MTWNEATSPRIAAIAGLGLRDLRLVTEDEIKEVFATVLRQVADVAPPSMRVNDTVNPMPPHRRQHQAADTLPIPAVHDYGHQHQPDIAQPDIAMAPMPAKPRTLAELAQQLHDRNARGY
jgi:hypothetical protein